MDTGSGEQKDEVRAAYGLDVAVQEADLVDALDGPEYLQPEAEAGR